MLSDVGGRKGVEGGGRGVGGIMMCLGVKGCRGYNGCLGYKWGALKCLG